MNKKLNLNKLFSLGKILPCSVLTVMITSNSPVFGQNNSNQNTSLELAILQEINKARTNPIAYADLLESNLLITNGGSPQEKVDQAINFLGNLSPLPAIANSPELAEIASAVVTENKANNSVNNNYGLIDIQLSENEIQAQKIILNLLNQQNKQEKLFNNSTNITGIACNPSSKKCIVAYPQANQIFVTDSRADILRDDSSNSPSRTSAPLAVRVSNPSVEENNTSNLSLTNNQEDINEREIDNSQTVAVTTLPSSLLERGTLQEGDLIIPSDGSLYDALEWQGKAGDSLQITLESQDFDTYLAVQNAQGEIIAENDDAIKGTSNSGLSITLPADGTYRLIINSYDPSGRGDYTISVEKN